jgi:hypothetical protein
VLAGAPAMAQSVADFESLDEGFHGDTIEVGGITFFEPDDRLSPPGSQVWAIDDGTGVWAINPGMLPFIQGKTLQINGYSGGPNGYAFLRAGSMRMTTGQVETAASLNVNFVVDDINGSYSSNTLTLEAILGGSVVATDAVRLDVVLGMARSFNFGAATLSISGVEFDELRLVSSGPYQLGAWQGGIDNVVIGESGCYADCDTSTGAGVLDVFDFLCFQDAFVNRDPYADCTSDTMFDIFDFLCFQDAFIAGCP